MLPKEKSYLNALTFPRFILAVMVVIHHYGRFTSISRNENGEVLKFIEFSNLAVSFFFFLSGFILIYNYWDRKISFKNFYIRRIGRLYPIYFLSIFSIVVFSIFINSVEYHGTVNLIRHLLGIQSWFSGTELTFNYPAWTLSVEFFFYAIFPLILLLIRKIPFWLNASLILAIYCLGIYQYYYYADYSWVQGDQAWNQFLIYFPLWHLNTFLMGILGGLIFIKIKNYKPNLYLYSVIALLSFGTFFYILGSNILTRYAHNGAFSALYLFICIALAKDKRVFNKLFGFKPLVFLGEISYGLYLWQFPVYIVYIHIFKIKELYGMHFYFYLVLLIIGSVISYKLVEKPARNYINKRFIKS